MAEQIQKVNLKDKKILKELDINARQSNSSIAKKGRLSKNIVNYRITRLEQEGIIKGYNTVFDASKLGYFLFRAYLDFYEYNQEKTNALIQYLIKEPKTDWVASTVGAWDLAVSFYIKDIYEFRKLWNNILDKFKDIIKDSCISIITECHYFRRAYLLGEKDDVSGISWQTGGSSPEKIDETDINITRMMAENAKISINIIASKTNLSSMTVIYRIKHLEKKNIILGYRANIDFSKIGYEYYKVDLNLQDTKIIKELIPYCRMHPHIVSINSTIGGPDFEFDMEVESFEQFLSVIEQLKKHFPKAIRDYKYFKLQKYHKIVYLPL